MGKIVFGRIATWTVRGMARLVFAVVAVDEVAEADILERVEGSHGLKVLLLVADLLQRNHSQGCQVVYFQTKNHNLSKF
jgi:hypothetical protein